MTAPLVSLRGVSKRYGATLAVRPLDLDIGGGEFVVLLGPSGSGKTTLLSIVGGFTEPSTGDVAIDGADVTRLPPGRRPTATVFQDYALFPHMNVAGNVGFGLAMHGVRGAERRRRVADALALVGLADFDKRGVHQLSGGQQQRVALARAIAVEPKVLLLDEPLGALDLALRRQMQDELTHIQKRLGTTFVHVTHDQEEAMSIADTIVVLNHGRIEDMGPARRVYLRPASLFTATFMGDSNLLKGRVESAAGGTRVATALGPLALAAEAETGAPLTVALRPEQLALAPPVGNALALGPARVIETTFQGTHLRLRAAAGTNGATTLLLRLPASAEVHPGDEIAVYADPADAVLLPATGE